MIRMLIIMSAIQQLLMQWHIYIYIYLSWEWIRLGERSKALGHLFRGVFLLVGEIRRWPIRHLVFMRPMHILLFFLEQLFKFFLFVLRFVYFVHELVDNLSRGKMVREGSGSVKTIVPCTSRWWNLPFLLLVRVHGSYVLFENLPLLSVESRY